MTKQKIILIEDDRVLSKVVYEELTEADFEVYQAFDGEEGLEAVRSKMPDLVLLDIMMPKMTGFAILENVQKDPLLRNIPIIVLTALGNDDDIKKGLQLGAKDYIVKSQHAVSEIIEKVKNFFLGSS